MPVLEGWVGHEVDVAIVGAGAAGIAAALHLGRRRPDLSVLVIEARKRIGGRAWTLSGPLPLDMGCGWLHGAQDNSWARIAAERGFALDTTPAPWNGGTRHLGLESKDEASADAAIRRFFERIDARNPEAPDCPLSDFLEPDGDWNAVIAAIGTYINGVELDQASTLDYDRYEPGPPPDWRVRDGYGTLIATCGQDVPVVLDAAVERVTHGDTRHLTIETTRGTLRCRAMVLTVATNLIAAGSIRFDPPLPKKLEAAAALPLGVADKLFLRLDPAAKLPRESHVMGNPFRVGTGTYHVHPMGLPVIEAYFGGEFARDLERTGGEAAFAVCVEELVRHFGSAVRPHLAPYAWSSWAQDPWACGSYSYARPGGADARSDLATPVEDRLFFAGEACSPARFSTAHGAYETGVAAADRAMKVL